MTVRLPSGVELCATVIKVHGRRADVFVDRYGQHRTYPVAWMRRREA